MAPKKAAKKTPAKKAQHSPSHDARRAFEHMGRVQAIAPLTEAEGKAITQLVSAADAAFQAREYKAAADLLRAAEHVSFATLQKNASETIAPDLVSAVSGEAEALLKRSAEHGSKGTQDKAIAALGKRLQRDAQAALRKGCYRAAIEFARAAEALAHMRSTKLSLPTGTSQKRLAE